MHKFKKRFEFMLAVTILQLSQSFISNAAPIVNEKGDIYYIDANNNIVSSYLDNNGQVYGPDGKILVSGLIFSDASEKEQLCTRVSNGETLRFDSLSELLDFRTYYDYFYSYAAFRPDIKYYQSGNSYIVESHVSNLQNAGVKQNIIYKYAGQLDLSSYANTTASITNILKRYNYDPSASTISVAEAVNTETGVCRQFTMIAKVLLENCGYECQVITGNNIAFTMPHMWLRVNVNGVWKYYDPTFATVNSGYNDISYEQYLTEYKANSTCTGLEAKDTLEVLGILHK